MSGFTTFGSDKPTLDKGLEMILLLITLVVISWFSINYPSLWDKARIFWSLSLTAMVGVLTSFVITKFFKIDFNVPLSEPPLFGFISKKLILIVSVVMFFTTFFWMSQAGYSISAPKFQIVDLGLAGDAMLTFFSALSENFFFFSFMAGLIFTLIYFVTKHPIVSLILTMLIVPFLFTVYHVLTYGFTETVEMTSVFIFGMEMMIWMGIAQDLFYTHMRHAGNNLGLLIFHQMTVVTLFTILLTSIWFWVVMIIGVIILAFQLKKWI